MKDDFKNAALNPGSLLVFTNEADPTFWTKVVLLLQHDQLGSVGVIINRVHDEFNYKDFARKEKVDPLKAQSDENRVFLDGGPSNDAMNVKGRNVYIPRVTVINEEKDGKIAYIDSNARDQFKRAKELEDSGATAVRVAIDYSGWGPGQLKAEIDAGAWRVLSSDGDLVFRTPIEEIFPKAAEKAGLHPDFIRYLVDPTGLREEKGGFKQAQEYLKSIWPKRPKQQASGKP